VSKILGVPFVAAGKGKGEDDDQDRQGKGKGKPDKLRGVWCTQAQAAVRGLPGLPTKFSSDALHWLLRLWPTQHYVAEARLRLAWRCYHQYWVGNIDD
jgi:hypothetical protein